MQSSCSLNNTLRGKFSPPGGPRPRLTWTRVRMAQATETGKTDPLSTVAAGGSGGDPPGPGKATRQGGPQDDWNLLSEASKLIMALGLLGTVLIIIRSELEKDRKRKRDAKEKKRKELEQASAIDGSVKKGGPPGDT